MIEQDIRKLVAYGLMTGLMEEEDKIYTTNRLLELFGLDELTGAEDTNNVSGAGCDASDGTVDGVSMEIGELEETLGRMMDYAVKEGIMEEDGIVYRDLFDTKIMSLLVPRPSEVIRKFRELYAKDARKATDFYYKFSQDTDYIRRYRIKKDQK